MGLSAVLRPWLFPLGFLVELACLEISGSFPQSGLILGDSTLECDLSSFALWRCVPTDVAGNRSVCFLGCSYHSVLQPSTAIKALGAEASYLKNSDRQLFISHQQVDHLSDIVLVV